jgi:hypothetical protein
MSCFVPLAVCPLAPSNVWEGKKSFCGFETGILCVVSEYSFFASTFYAQSYVHKLKHSEERERKDLFSTLYPKEQSLV